MTNVKHRVVLGDYVSHCITPPGNIEDRARADALELALLTLLKEVCETEGAWMCESEAKRIGITHHARCEPCDNTTAPVLGKTCVVCWSIISSRINRNNKPI